MANLQPFQNFTQAHPRRINVQRLEGVTSYNLSLAVTRLRSVRGVQRAVLRAMCDRYPNCWPSIETLADQAGFGTSITRKHLRGLEAAGLVELVGSRRGGRGATAQYRINVGRLYELMADGSGSSDASPTGMQNVCKTDANAYAHASDLHKDNTTCCLSPETQHVVPETQHDVLPNIEVTDQKKITEKKFAPRFSEARRRPPCNCSEFQSVKEIIAQMGSIESFARTGV